MIEVEIRGRLTTEERDRLLSLFKKEGMYVESQDRQMILLSDYPGYDDDPTKRATDIRLRNTNGKCEIVLKRKAHDHNVGRSETILKLQDHDLGNAQEVAKAFGSSRGLWMHRKKEIYTYQGTEWSLVEAAPKAIFFYEAEKMLGPGDDVENAKAELSKEAAALGLPIFTPEEYVGFVEMLGREVNKKIDW